MTTNTRPVPNTQSAIAATADGKIRVFLITPWTQFFQQFVQKAPAAINVSSSAQPYQANQRGKIIISWPAGAPTVNFYRGNPPPSGTDPIIDLSGVHIIPIAIGDTLTWTFVGNPATDPTVLFYGD